MYFSAIARTWARIAVENSRRAWVDRGIVLGLAQRPVALQRELGVERDRARRIGQPQQAIDPLAAASVAWNS